uniref:Putative ovule protein n=1 Tax=Solanum chacoense TaxID=4108 RepID=A0A0V0I6K4_SOLCH
MRTVHSTWPVILMLYILPPWMCMKEEFFILSLLIPRPKAPLNRSLIISIGSLVLMKEGDINPIPN